MARQLHVGKSKQWNCSFVPALPLPSYKQREGGTESCPAWKAPVQVGSNEPLKRAVSCMSCCDPTTNCWFSWCLYQWSAGVSQGRDDDVWYNFIYYRSEEHHHPATCSRTTICLVWEANVLQMGADANKLSQIFLVVA